jgi:hypothetical protein
VEVPAHDIEAPARAVEVAGGAAAAAPAAPTTSAGTSRKRKRAFSSLRKGVALRGVACPTGGDVILCFCVCRVTPTVPPLALAKVLRTDASVPTRRRSSRATRAAAVTAVAASGSSQGAAKASRPRPVTPPTGPQPAVAEARRAPAVTEAQQTTAASETVDG